jgi:all-trans-retinol 13,14-reductase
MKAASFDAVVVGSGIGGLTAAAALAKQGRRVLVLEQHARLGGLTQTFRRGEYTFATGVHYLASLDEEPGRLLAWLTDGRLEFASVGSPYDVVELPGLTLPIEAPRAADVERLKALFPAESAGIDGYFAAVDEARSAARAIFSANAAPLGIAGLIRALHAGKIRRALAVSSLDSVRGFRDRRLAAVLLARWGDYGVPPERAPFAMHALVMGSYFAGAWFPVGGPARFAQALGETIAAAGGELRAASPVAQIRVAHGRVAGVQLASGEVIAAPVVVSAMGAHNTVAALPAGTARGWGEAVDALAPTLSYVSLYLGIRGDIRSRGASAANLWLYRSSDVGRLWRRPAEEEAPAIYVSFPSLKDPAHADAERHTAEVVALVPWQPFAAWADSSPGRRPAAYREMKHAIAQRLLAQFGARYPQIAPLVERSEVSTPLSQAFFTHADRGAMYGLEMTAARLSGRALAVRTPVRGLRLAGQDACSPGIPGAVMGGFLAAASVEPGLWRRLHA